MDLRTLVITDDSALEALVRSQVENLGCPCNVADSYQDAVSRLPWADVAIVDLGPGVELLHQVRIEAPTVDVVAIVTDESLSAEVLAAGAVSVLSEPFNVSDLVDAMRALRPPEPPVIDLTLDTQVEDAPWWASR